MAFEAGRDGLWLARWLRARGIEAYVIHATSIAVSREHWRAKTDRLDTELLKASFHRLAARGTESSQYGLDPEPWRRGRQVAAAGSAGARGPSQGVRVDVGARMRDIWR